MLRSTLQSFYRRKTFFLSIVFALSLILFLKQNPGRIHSRRLLKASENIETTIPYGAAANGFTIFDRLYMRNGTFYVVSSNTDKFPSRRRIIARPGPMIGHDMEPTDKELQFISPESMKSILGDYHIRLEGFSVILHEDVEFMRHYYHWWGEIMLGFWRVYSMLRTSNPEKTLSPPTRFLLTNSFREEWRDKAGIDGPLMQAAFPNTALETGNRWADLIQLGITVEFERAMIISRPAAHTSPEFVKYSKMIASTMQLNPPFQFWEPLRRQVVLNSLGFVPELDSHGVVISPPYFASRVPVVTYISRQSDTRRLLPESHESLVVALKGLANEGLCELHITAMEKLDITQQIAIVSRTTHQLWMPSSPHSTVFEILHPPSFTFDYKMLADNMGHRHYAVWNDTLITYPRGKYHEGGVKYYDGFWDSSYPVHGPAIAQAIRARLAEHVS